MRVDGDDVLGWDDFEDLHARPNLREAQKVQRGVRIELARFPERGIGHDHRPHLGELNEQDVPRPANRRGRQSDEALDAVDEGEEKHKRDSDPIVDYPHQVRIHGSLVSTRAVSPRPRAFFAHSVGGAASAAANQSRASSLTCRSRLALGWFTLSVRLAARAWTAMPVLNGNIGFVRGSIAGQSSQKE